MSSEKGKSEKDIRRACLIGAYGGLISVLIYFVGLWIAGPHGSLVEILFYVVAFPMWLSVSFARVLGLENNPIVVFAGTIVFQFVILSILAFGVIRIHRSSSKRSDKGQIID
jgi:hypothetical protein